MLLLGLTSPDLEQMEQLGFAVLIRYSAGEYAGLP